MRGLTVQRGLRSIITIKRACMSSIYAALECPERIKAMVLMLPSTAWETRIAQARRYRLLALVGLLVGVVGCLGQ